MAIASAGLQCGFFLISWLGAEWARMTSVGAHPWWAQYRGTSLIRTPPLPLGPPQGPRHVLLYSPRGARFLISEVPL